MWLISIEAIPNAKENPEAAKEYGGACINCWIDFPIEDGAVELAKFYVKQNGWSLLGFVDENLWFEEEDCETTEQRQYFSDAKECGICLVWYHYLFEAAEEDEDFELENSTTNNPKVKKLEH
jgi:hypothetical protein